MSEEKLDDDDKEQSEIICKYLSHLTHINADVTNIGPESTTEQILQYHKDKYKSAIETSTQNYHYQFITIIEYICNYQFLTLSQIKCCF